MAKKQAQERPTDLSDAANDSRAFLLDKRAKRLAAILDAPDDLLVREPVAADLLEVGDQWLSARRHYADGGPPYLKIGRMVRYRVGDLRAWLEERASQHRERRQLREETKRRLRESQAHRRAERHEDGDGR